MTVIFTNGDREATNATITILDNDQIGKWEFLGYTTLIKSLFSTGTIVNDSIIGDPLFTVTLPQEDAFMCYEVHGEANRYFNLISDTCISVNAQYSGLVDQPRINMIGEIGIYAKESGSSGGCVEIRIRYSGCSGSVNGDAVTTTYQSKGISVRAYPKRWRVSVPNCGSTQVVMWVFCKDPPEMLRFHIARGNNLSPTSHGLLGE